MYVTSKIKIYGNINQKKYKKEGDDTAAGY